MRWRRHISDSIGVADGRIPLMSFVQTLAVAEYLNFQPCCQRARRSQSSVSTRIKTLEDDLGILLFERRHRGVRLTDAGQRFVAEVAVGIGHIDLAVQTAGAISSGVVDPGDCHARRLWEEPFKIVLPIDDALKATFRLGTP